jgi:hypothetical protein
MSRELSVVVKELESALNDVQSKLTASKEAEKASAKAAVEHREAQDKAAMLKQELESFFNSLVPSSVTDRVRTSN